MQMVRTGRVRLEKRSSLWLSVASSVPVACVLVLWADRKLLVFLLHGWVAAEGHMCSLSGMNISQNFLLLSHWWLCDNLNFFLGGKKTTTWKWYWGFWESPLTLSFLPTHTFCVEKLFLTRMKIFVLLVFNVTRTHLIFFFLITKNLWLLEKLTVYCVYWKTEVLGLSLSVWWHILCAAFVYVTLSPYKWQTSPEKC